MNLSEYRSGSTEPWTADVLAALVAAKKPSVLIETGTYRAFTTLRLLTAMETYASEWNSILYSVECDPERAKAAETLLTGNRSSWNILQGDALQVLRDFPGRADFIFLDDDHNPDHVRCEVQAAKAILSPGGIICLHDVCGIFGLDRIVKEFGGVVLDLPRLHVSGGLGIIA